MSPAKPLNPMPKPLFCSVSGTFNSFIYHVYLPAYTYTSYILYKRKHLYRSLGLQYRCSLSGQNQIYAEVFYSTICVA
jgi:hypothetical protein